MDRIRFLICLSIDFPLEKHYDKRTKFRINILLHRVRFLISRHVSNSYILLYRFLFHWIAYHHCKLKKKKTLLTKKEWRNAATIYIYIYIIESSLICGSIYRSLLDPFSIPSRFLGSGRGFVFVDEWGEGGGSLFQGFARGFVRVRMVSRRYFVGDLGQ